MATIAERVAAGAAYLDESEPGWEKHIDLTVLDIDSMRDCVIGQLYPRFHDARRTFDHGLGFDADCYGPNSVDAVMAQCRELTAEWKRIIFQRRPQ